MQQEILNSIKQRMQTMCVNYACKKIPISKNYIKNYTLVWQKALLSVLCMIFYCPAYAEPLSMSVFHHNVQNKLVGGGFRNDVKYKVSDLGFVFNAPLPGNTTLQFLVYGGKLDITSAPIVRQTINTDTLGFGLGIARNLSNVTLTAVASRATNESSLLRLSGDTSNSATYENDEFILDLKTDYTIPYDNWLSGTSFNMVYHHLDQPAYKEQGAGGNSIAQQKVDNLRLVLDVHIERLFLLSARSTASLGFSLGLSHQLDSISINGTANFLTGLAGYGFIVNPTSTQQANFPHRNSAIVKANGSMQLADGWRIGATGLYIGNGNISGSNALIELEKSF